MKLHVTFNLTIIIVIAKYTYNNENIDYKKLKEIKQ